MSTWALKSHSWVGTCPRRSISAVDAVRGPSKNLGAVVAGIAFTMHFGISLPQFWKQGEEAYLVRWNLLINTRGWHSYINPPSMKQQLQWCLTVWPMGLGGSLSLNANARKGVLFLKSLLPKTECRSYRVQKILPGGPCFHPALSLAGCVGNLCWHSFTCT